jgi:predicted AAA+ superfamily ATPase
LVVAVDPEGVSAAKSDAAAFGARVENACLAFAWNSGQRVSYWREEPFEVDGVLEGSWGRWAIEVKTGRFEIGQLGGLLEFVRRNPRFKPLVVCTRETRSTAERAEVLAVDWRDFLLGRRLPGRA